MIHKIDQNILGRLYCSECGVYQTDLPNVSVFTSNKKPYLRFVAKCPNCSSRTEFKLRGKYVSDKTLIKQLESQTIDVLNDIRNMLIAIIVFSLMILVYTSLKDILRF